MPLRYERELTDLEDDTSDSNLGLCFEHRLSFFALACAHCSDAKTIRENDDNLPREACNQCVSPLSPRTVRVSLRARLNEYHEASYHLDLECETSLTSAINTPRERFARHNTIVAVHRALVLPWLRKHWPDGLLFDGLRSVPLKEALDELSLIRAVTGPNCITRTNMMQELASRIVHHAESSLVAKLKYDGAFGVLINGALRLDRREIRQWPLTCTTTIEAAAPSEEERRDTPVLSGQYVYQIETMRNGNIHYADVITEIVCIGDHEELLRTQSNGALVRRVECTEYAEGAEQRNSLTAYAVTSENRETINEWAFIA
ncbi:uncharacterized protein LOC112588678 [Harpegnathos saltator]|uniref:uncharacterized protein LOC112588678 n=1 Tax=Harpegnathos saltator TaxID=610380 RepID=UPI000DBED72C|nr:uncharacterized protein LOC112588678 [Harpegnathos saltator]